MLIAQISDTHIAKEGEKTFGQAPMAENLARVVAHINALTPLPELVLHSGDVTNGGTIAEAENALHIMSALSMPRHVVPGNHDSRQGLSDVFDIPFIDGFLNHVTDNHKLRLIGVDSTIPGAAGGEMCALRLAWLDEVLGQDLQKPTIIFMHHPPVKCGVNESDVDGFIGAEELGAIIEKYNNIERILCGHIHLPTHSRWHGTIVSTAPSTGMRLGLDLTRTRQSEFYLAPPSFQLHHWTKNNNLVSHVVTVDDAEGPFPF